MNIREASFLCHMRLCCQSVVGCYLLATSRHLLSTNKYIMWRTVLFSTSEAQHLTNSMVCHPHKREQCSGINSHFDGYSQQSTRPIVMLLKEDQHGIVEHMYVSEARLLSAFSLVMEYLYGQIPVLVACL